MRNLSGKPVIFAVIFFSLFSHAAASDMETAAVFPGLSYPIEMALPAGAEAGKTMYETAFSVPPARDYDTLLLQGEMPDPEMRIEVETRASAFFLPDSSCKQTGFRRFPNGRFWAKYKLGPVGRQPIRLIVVNLGLKAGSTLTIYGSELQKETSMRETREPLQDIPYVPDAALSLPANAPFALVRRGAWQAAPPKEPYTQHAPRYFTLHHTQAHYPKTYEESVAEIQFIQDFHQNGRGWNDIGYHFLIDPLGNIFEGRPLGVVGAHVLYRNTGNVGISMMGSFQAPVSNPLTDATVNSFAAVATYLKDTYTVNRSSFYAHRDLQDTDCPGDELYAKMEYLRAFVFDPRPVPVITGNAVPEAQAAGLRRLIDYLDK